MEGVKGYAQGQRLHRIDSVQGAQKSHRPNRSSLGNVVQDEPSQEDVSCKPRSQQVHIIPKGPVLGIGKVDLSPKYPPASQQPLVLAMVVPRT